MKRQELQFCLKKYERFYWFYKWERGAIKVSVFFLLASFGSIHAQTIKGTVVSKVNGALPGANISIVDADTKAISSLDGDFNLLSPKLGEVKLKVEYIGYHTKPYRLS